MTFVECNNLSSISQSIVIQLIIFFHVHFCRKGSGNIDSKLRRNSDRQDSKGSIDAINGDMNTESEKEDKAVVNEETSNGKHQDDLLASEQEETLKKKEEKDDEKRINGNGIEHSDNEANITKLQKPPPNKVSFLIQSNVNLPFKIKMFSSRTGKFDNLRLSV